MFELGTALIGLSIGGLCLLVVMPFAYLADLILKRFGK
jgi:hypothetical protein